MNNHFLEFAIDMLPVGKQRARVTRRGTAYTPKQTVKAEKMVRDAARFAMGDKQPITTAVHLTVVGVFPVPVSYRGDKRSRAMRREICPPRPDADNIVKLVSDAMNGVVYVDDAQVSGITAYKVYGKQPQLLVRIAYPQPIDLPDLGFLRLDGLASSPFFLVDYGKPVLHVAHRKSHDGLRSAQ